VTGNGDLKGLWRETLLRPLAEAVAATERFGSWRPADDAGRTLFERLAATDPDVLASFGAAGVLIPGRYVRELSFSPDLSEVAVIQGMAEPVVTEIHALPGGGLVDRRAVPTRTLESYDHQLVHLGDAVVYLERHTKSGHWRWRVVRCRRPEWTPEVLHEFVGSTTVLGQLPGGFVVGAPELFLFGTADGPLRGPVSLHEDRSTTLLTTDPASGRMAVVVGEPGSSYAQSELVVLDADLRMLGSAPIGVEAKHVNLGWFCGPDRLLTQGSWYHLKSWEVGDGALELRHSRHLDKWEHRYASHLPPLGTTPLPVSKRVAVQRNVDPPLWLDACTMDERKAPGFGSRCPIWVSPGGEYVVFDHRDGIEICDLRRFEIADLLARPMARMRMADLATIPALEVSEDATEVLGLLKACVEHPLRQYQEP